MLAQKEHASRFQKSLDDLENGREVRRRNMQQAIERVDRIEGCGREIQLEEVHDMGVEALLSAPPHVLRGEIRCDDVESVFLEEQAVLAGPSSDLQQALRVLGPKEIEEPLPFLDFQIARSAASRRSALPSYAARESPMTLS